MDQFDRQAYQFINLACFMGNGCCSVQKVSETDHQVLDQKNQEDHHSVHSENFNQFIIQDYHHKRRIVAKEAAPWQLKQIYCNIGIICFQRIQNGSKALSYATGSIIQDRLILTSAHTFVHREEVGQKIEICRPLYFYYKVHGHFSEEAKYEVEDYRVNQIYMDIYTKRCGADFHTLNLTQKQQLISLDYAVIKLKKSVKNIKIPNILKDYTFGHSSSQEVAIFGYPKEMYKINYGDVVGAKICGDINKMIDIKGNYLIHNVETSAGQSGSPIVFFTSTNSGKEDLWYIGIHSGYYPSKSCSDKRYYSGPLIMSTTVASFFQWEKEMLSEQERKGFNIWELINNTPVKISSYLDSKPKNIPIELKDIKLDQSFKNEYKKLIIQFDIRIQQASYYSIGKNIVKRTQYMPQNNTPFHLTTRNPVPQGKWSFSLRINNYCYDQIVFIGFMSQFRKYSQHHSSGNIKQKDCVSLAICKDAQKASKASQIRRKGALLIQGDLLAMQEALFLKQKQEILTIYIDTKEKIIYWDFGKGVVRSTSIPKSVYTPSMFFFIGLSHNSQQIEILD